MNSHACLKSRRDNSAKRNRCVMDYGICPGRLAHGNIEGFDMMCGVVQVILADEKMCKGAV